MRVEAIALKLVGLCFLVLAGYVAYDAVNSLIASEPPAASYVGYRRRGSVAGGDANSSTGEAARINSRVMQTHSR